jgi:hypothetical protein
MLPFTLSSCIALLFSIFGGGFSGIPAGDAPSSFPPLIGAAEYRAHAEYQQHFSLLPLGRHGFEEASYFHYNKGKDGLIADAGSPMDTGLLEGGLREIPPFPLEALMAFLGKPDPAVGMRGISVFELLPVLLVLLLGIPVLSGGRQGKGKKKGPAIYNDKRIAA